MAIAKSAGKCRSTRECESGAEWERRGTVRRRRAEPTRASKMTRQPLSLHLLLARVRSAIREVRNVLACAKSLVAPPPPHPRAFRCIAVTAHKRRRERESCSKSCPLKPRAYERDSMSDCQPAERERERKASSPIPSSPLSRFLASPKVSRWS